MLMNIIDFLLLVVTTILFNVCDIPFSEGYAATVPSEAKFKRMSGEFPFYIMPYTVVLKMKETVVLAQNYRDTHKRNRVKVTGRAQ